MLKVNLPIVLLFIYTICLSGCNSTPTLFEQLSPNHTGVTFSNRINTNDTLNIITTEYVYNGGGVGIADFNNDGLQDIFFSGNQVGNELYINKGEFKFENISKSANINVPNRWCSGVSIVDINADGLMDVYVSATLYKDSNRRKNLLFVNQGLLNGYPSFKEIAEEYGIADNGHGEHAAFFDYDNDGDLDLYVLIDVIDQNPSIFREKVNDGSYPNTDRLYKNEYSQSLGHPVFKNVSNEAGITKEGFGLGLTICDINLDGWKDIYVTNDYAADDLVYINNKDGTFSDEASRFFKHTSNSAMGNDVADINNDGLPDMVALDMKPEDNVRKKLLASPNNYYTYQFADKFSYNHQYVRNTLQLNSGYDPANKQLPFSEISLLAGVANTDWSWCPSLADFDNDGFRDLLITNGFPKDVTDRDFMAFRQGISSIASADYLMPFIPEVKISNYAFKNNGDLTFEDKTSSWGLNIPSFSNGAAYGDLDNDGDLDYVVNNINDSAFVFKNTLRELNPENSNYLRIQFKGDAPNNIGLGAVVKGTFENGTQFYAENLPVRGYLSSVEPIIHIGLKSDTLLKELIIIWPSGKAQKLNNIKANQVLTAHQAEANLDYNFDKIPPTTLFDEQELNFKHEETDFIDFNIQNLLPQKLSQSGPSMAVGDVNNDGLDDVYIGGSRFKSGSLLIQTFSGNFVEKLLFELPDPTQKLNEEMGSLLFDADQDGDLDLYIVNGGNEGDLESNVYHDQFFINDGKGNFQLLEDVIPKLTIAGSCVRADDYDNDGDLDLFIGGRNSPFQYPKATSSILLRNESIKGKIHFTDVTNSVIPAMINVGMVNDAIWTDIDNDGDRDLMIAGDFMPISVFENSKGKFEKMKATGLESFLGMFSSLNGGDFDGDGDIDFIAGNVGRNALFKGSAKYPSKIISGDLDNNGNYDVIPFTYLPESNRIKSLKLVPFNSKDDVDKQLNLLKGRFITYEAFGAATFENLLDPKMMQDAEEHTLNFNPSIYIENKGQGKFEVKELPLPAQVSPVNGILIEDFNNDTNMDVLLIGNNYGNELSVGRYDASNGLLLLGDGRGDFKPTNTSGFNVTGDSKALVKYINNNGSMEIIASQNRGEAKRFRSKISGKVINPRPDQTRINYLYKGKKVVIELYHGSSYLSQSSRKVLIPKDAEILSIH
ncbi:MAG: hypothetical protein ACI9IP_000886 [Arcticibacterium sp.]|jgi:hypothetical protein